MELYRYLEIAGTAIGLVYLWLEYRASIWLWLAGIIMPAVYIYVYYASGFYADMGINVYYLFAGLYGWLVWIGKPSGKDGGRVPVPITRTPRKYFLPLGIIAFGFFIVIAWLLMDLTDSTVPYGDSLTTALSIVGLWMLARKYVEQWLVWFVVDVVCCGLYLYKGLWFTAGLYGLYGVVSVFGYYKWLSLMRQRQH